MKRLLAGSAALALAALDYIVVSAAFLNRPKLGEALLALAAIGAVAAWLWRRPLPLFATQNLLLAAAAVHAVNAGSPLDAQAAITLVVSFLVGNGLAWLAARGLPARG